jgi:hypothetical protein
MRESTALLTGADGVELPANTRHSARPPTTMIHPVNKNAATIMIMTKSIMGITAFMIDYLAAGTGARLSVCPQKMQYWSLRSGYAPHCGHRRTFSTNCTPQCMQNWSVASIGPRQCEQARFSASMIVWVGRSVCAIDGCGILGRAAQCLRKLISRCKTLVDPCIRPAKRLIQIFRHGMI